jgi:hypothetical protein
MPPLAPLTHTPKAESNKSRRAAPRRVQNAHSAALFIGPRIERRAHTMNQITPIIYTKHADFDIQRVKLFVVYVTVITELKAPLHSLKWKRFIYGWEI